MHVGNFREVSERKKPHYIQIFHVIFIHAYIRIKISNYQIDLRNEFDKQQEGFLVHHFALTI